MLTFPLILAAVSAGFFGGFHCVGMCGGMSHLFSSMVGSRQSSSIDYQSQTSFKAIPIRLASADKFSFSPFGVANTANVYLHAGRLLTYALIGAFLGGLGGITLGWGVAMPTHQIWYALGNMALIFLGLRLLGLRLPARLHPTWRSLMVWTSPAWKRGAQHPFALGLAWGGLPCGLSLAVAPFALLSGAAWSGAVLMLLFGLAALPHLLIAQALSHRLKTMRSMRLLQTGMALILIGFGVAGCWFPETLKASVLYCL